MINKHKQKGFETLEFTLIAVLLLAVLFAIIELSRTLFIWNALAEATRRGARMAAVCPVDSPIPKQVAIFDVVGGTLGTSTVVPGLVPGNIRITYLNNLGVAETTASLIKFVQVEITGFSNQLHIPLWGSTIQSPGFRTIMTAESLGAVSDYPPDTAGTFPFPGIPAPTSCNYGSLTI